MAFFLIPSHVRIEVVLSFDPLLTKLLKQVVDQGDDRAEAAKLAIALSATTAALAAVLPTGKETP